LYFALLFPLKITNEMFITPASELALYPSPLQLHSCSLLSLPPYRRVALSQSQLMGLNVFAAWLQCQWLWVDSARYF
jgi:hypothetical protein